MYKNLYLTAVLLIASFKHLPFELAYSFSKYGIWLYASVVFCKLREKSLAFEQRVSEHGFARHQKTVF